jgi:hypothetical protein
MGCACRGWPRRQSSEKRKRRLRLGMMDVKKRKGLAQKLLAEDTHAHTTLLCFRDERNKDVQKQISARQAKRQANIDARITNKKDKKIEKVRCFPQFFSVSDSLRFPPRSHANCVCLCVLCLMQRKKKLRPGFEGGSAKKKQKNPKGK